MSDPNSTHPNRRTFLQIAGAIVGASVSGASTEASPAVVPQAAATLSAGFAAPPIPEVRVGFVGVGGQGGAHVRNMLAVPGVRVTAVCDIAEERVKLMQKLVVAAGQKEPTGYARGPRDFERLCETEDVDLVFTATPWEWHVPVCVAAMKNGKHAATEVPAAMTLDDCWQLVEHAEKHKQALRDDGELQLRPSGDDGLQHGPAGRLRRGPARRRRLPARSARDQVRGPR